jgi:hypothetical protein
MTERAFRCSPSSLVLTILLVSTVLTPALNGAEPDPLAKLGFLLGDWKAVRSGKPGEGTGQATFTSDPVAEQPRFRLMHEFVPTREELRGRFEIAPPDKPNAFAEYLSWTSVRVGAGSKAKS